MSQHDSLRNRTAQHKPKNTKSKYDDKDVYKAMGMVDEYLRNKDSFKKYFASEWDLEFDSKINVEYMVNFIKKKNIRKEFDMEFIDRTIKPDGGILYLVKKSTGEKFPLVIAEIKHQGTNKERLAEGKDKQATGNAIERLGKNLTGIRAMMNYEEITPFVCFGWGDDFDINNVETGTVRSKVIMMNQFYSLNEIYVYKRDGNANNNYFAPVSMFFREDKWTPEEMFAIMKEIAETSIRYYLY
jgi:type II restriction enzyme